MDVTISRPIYYDKWTYYNVPDGSIMIMTNLKEMLSIELMTLVDYDDETESRLVPITDNMFDVNTLYIPSLQIMIKKKMIMSDTLSIYLNNWLDEVPQCVAEGFCGFCKSDGYLYKVKQFTDDVFTSEIFICTECVHTIHRVYNEGIDIQGSKIIRSFGYLVEIRGKSYKRWKLVPIVTYPSIVEVNTLKGFCDQCIQPLRFVTYSHNNAIICEKCAVFPLACQRANVIKCMMIRELTDHDVASIVYMFITMMKITINI